MAQITQLTTWVDEQVLTHTALNEEFQQIINTANALGNANWAAAGVDNLDGKKINVNTNTTFLVEHTDQGVHTAIAGNNMDNCFVKRASDTVVQVTFDRINVYSSDTITTRDRLLVQAAAAASLNADITATGASGRETGSTEGASEWWYIWVIYTTTGTAAAFLSLNDTIAGFVAGGGWPTGYSYAKLVGKVYNNASSNFEVPIPIAGGTYFDKFAALFTQYEQGSYTATGSGQTITGVLFDPDLVIVHIGDATPAVNPFFVVRSSLDTGSNSWIIGSAGNPITTGITALTADGFTVSTNGYVDTTNEVYHWHAFKQSAGVGS